MNQLKLQTTVEIPHAEFCIEPTDRILFVGSCFADNIGALFKQNMFQVIVNPFGVMYNPASVCHTINKAFQQNLIDDKGVDFAVITLGTNHVYILNETGEIVDNCQKRPQHLFTEKELNVSECVEHLRCCISELRRHNPQTKVVLTVSPIRYAKYGFHGSRLSKAALLLAADILVNEDHTGNTYYFPAYEIMNDELRDYRFYKPDMIHPSEQAVDYIFHQFAEVLFSDRSHQFMKEWQPIYQKLSHRPFNPQNPEYTQFLEKAKSEKEIFLRKWRVDMDNNKQTP